MHSYDASKQCRYLTLRFDIQIIYQIFSVGLTCDASSLLDGKHLSTDAWDSNRYKLCIAHIRFVLILLREGIYVYNLLKSKKFDLVDILSDTSRYLDDILTIDNPDFEQHISDIYLAELHLNNANETPFLDLNIKVVDDDIHTSVYDKRDDFGFLIVKFSWLSGDAPRLPSYGIYISQLIRFARCCTSV